MLHFLSFLIWQLFCKKEIIRYWVKNIMQVFLLVIIWQIDSSWPHTILQYLLTSISIWMKYNRYNGYGFKSIIRGWKSVLSINACGKRIFICLIFSLLNPLSNICVLELDILKTEHTLGKHTFSRIKIKRQNALLNSLYIFEVLPNNCLKKSSFKLMNWV